MKMRSLLIGGVIGLCAAGCGGGSNAVPCQGRVTLDGAPLPDASVSFLPIKATDPGPFTDTTDADGKFSLGLAGEEVAGVQPGVYSVFVSTVKPIPGADESTPPPAQREVVPQAYRDGSTRIDVPEGGVQDLELNLDSR
jgi:hypothetical protein